MSELNNILNFWNTFNTSDFEQLLKDCGDLDFEALTHQNESDVNNKNKSDSNNNTPSTQVLPIPQSKCSGNNGCIPTLTIEFSCESNPSVKHFAKLGFSCEMKCQLPAVKVQGPSTCHVCGQIPIKKTRKRSAMQKVTPAIQRKGVVARRKGKMTPLNKNKGKGRPKRLRKWKNGRKFQIKKDAQLCKKFGIHKKCKVALTRLPLLQNKNVSHLSQLQTMLPIITGNEDDHVQNKPNSCSSSGTPIVRSIRSRSSDRLKLRIPVRYRRGGSI